MTNQPGSGKPARRLTRRGSRRSVMTSNGDIPRIEFIGDEGSSNTSMFFLWAGRWLVIAMLVISPWWIASVYQLPQLVLYGLAIAGMAMLWFAVALGKRARHPFPWLAFPVILGLLLLVVQTMELPEWAGPVLAQKQLEMYTAFAEPVPGELLVDKSNPERTPLRITMDLDGTTRSINLLTLGLLGVVLASYFFSARNARVLLPLAATINGVVISSYGILQRVKSENRLFGYIELEHHGTPFGPFVNQNNAAGYLLICLACSIGLIVVAFNRRMDLDQRPRTIITNDYPIWQRARLHVALFLAELDAVKLVSLLATTLIAAGVVATLSRGGFLALAAATFAVAVYYSMAKKSFAALGIGALLSTAVFIGINTFGFSESMILRLNRASDSDFITNEARLRHWTQTSPAISEFFPMGSGVGSYHNVHRLYRVDSENNIFYFAENQYFQTLVEAGWCGLLLLFSAIGILAVCVRFLGSFGSSAKTQSLCVTGIFLLVSQTITSIFDFGHFIAANTIAMALVSGMLVGQAHSLAGRIKKPTSLRYTLPSRFAIVLLLLIFSAGIFCGLSTLQYAKTEHCVGKSPSRETPSTTSLETIDQRIDLLKARVNVHPDSDACQRLGELYILRYRLMLFDKLKRILPNERASDPKLAGQTWLSTGLDRLQLIVQTEWRSGNRNRLRAVQDDALVKSNLLPAIWYLKKSRSRSPLQPVVHLLLGQLHAIGEQPDPDQPHLLRAQQLSPANAVTHFICGLMDLQANRIDSACNNLGKCLQIDPLKYDIVVRATTPSISVERIVSDIIPEDPRLLYRFATNYLLTQSSQSLKKETLQRARNLLIEEKRDDRKSLELLAEIEIALGNTESATVTLRRLVDSNPDIRKLRISLINLLKDQGKFEEALDEIKWMKGFGDESGQLDTLRENIIRLRDSRLFQ